MTYRGCLCTWRLLAFAYWVVCVIALLPVALHSSRMLVHDAVALSRVQRCLRTHISIVLRLSHLKVCLLSSSVRFCLERVCLSALGRRTGWGGVCRGIRLVKQSSGLARRAAFGASLRQRLALACVVEFHSLQIFKL